MNKLLCILLAIALNVSLFVISSCEEETEITEEQERVKSLSSGAWYSSQTATVPDDDDPNLFDNLTMVFGSDSEHEPTYFKIQNFPVFETNDYSTWDLFGINNVSCNIDDTGDFSFMISAYTDTAMTIAFTWINPDVEYDYHDSISCCSGDYYVDMYR